MSDNAVSGCHPARLSICITTRNRAEFIGATLESILSQSTSNCEVVVVDGASVDATESVVGRLTAQYSNLRYHRQVVNNGAERGFDEAVRLASGEYCWLMPDDDLLKPGAVAAVLETLRREPSLVVVNVEYKDFEMSRLVHLPGLDHPIAADREFAPADLDGLFDATRRLIRYLGSVIIRRSLWLSREKERYFGSYWAHIGVIFQERLPGPAILLAAPLVSVRLHNQSWLQDFFAIFNVHWPALISSLALSESTRRIYSGDVCLEPDFLLIARAAGQYSWSEYRTYVRPHVPSLRKRLFPALVALSPGTTLNSLLMLRYSLWSRSSAPSVTALLNQSRFNPRSRWRALTSRLAGGA